MAGDQKISYPSMPVKQWWALRDKFRQSIPSTVTPGYLAAVLGMQESSAKSNILSYLIDFGIIDVDGKPKERARQWRDDAHYSEVCDQIRQEIYPDELLDALPAPNPDRTSVDRWFANKTGVGTSAAQRMSAVYLMLCDADVAKRQEVTKTSTAKNAKPVIKKPATNHSKSNSKTIPQNVKDEEENSPPQVDEIDLKKTQKNTPALHVDIQIHISPTASSEQIDQIFASMAKHLYGKS